MASGYQTNGTDLDDLFMVRGSTTKRADIALATWGVDLSNRFRAVKPGHGGDMRSSNTGHKSGGADLKTMFVDIDFVLGPTIDTQPTNQSGTSVTFTIAATAYYGSLTYQWQKWNGSSWDNVGTNSSSYGTSTAGTYRCKVWDGDGDTYAKISDSVTATIYLPPSIVTHPSGGTYTNGTGPHAMLCDASGDGTLYFEWQKWNGSSWVTYQSVRAGNLDADSDQHVWNPIASGDAGTYRCFVSSTYGNAASNSAVITVV